MRAFLSGTTQEEMLRTRMNDFCDQMNHLGRRIEALAERIAPSNEQNGR